MCIQAERLLLWVKKLTFSSKVLVWRLNRRHFCLVDSWFNREKLIFDAVCVVEIRSFAERQNMHPLNKIILFL